MARPNCVDCTRKHISQAIVLVEESHNGYSIHKWLAMGHLAEAEAEIRVFDADLSRRIRKARLEIQEGQDPDLLHFIIEITDRYNRHELVNNQEGYKYWDDDSSEVTISKKGGKK